MTRHFLRLNVEKILSKTYKKILVPQDALVLRSQGFDLAWKSVVEFGCGTGRHTEWFLRQHGKDMLKYTAMDASKVKWGCISSSLLVATKVCCNFSKKYRPNNMLLTCTPGYAPDCQGPRPPVPGHGPICQGQVQLRLPRPDQALAHALQQRRPRLRQPRPRPHREPRLLLQGGGQDPQARREPLHLRAAPLQAVPGEPTSTQLMVFSLCDPFNGLNWRVDVKKTPLTMYPTVSTMWSKNDFPWARTIHQLDLCPNFPKCFFPPLAPLVSSDQVWKRGKGCRSFWPRM